MADITTPGSSPLAHGSAHDHAHAHHPRQQHHFYSMAQQLEASILGMWVFLVTEVMFFGGLFTAYIVYRWMYPDAWVAGSHELNVYLGGANTIVLICSSLTTPRPASAKDFALIAIVDCGAKSGKPCPDGTTIIGVRTDQISGKLQTYKVDVSWVLKQAPRLHQDDEICVEVRDDARTDGVLQAIAFIDSTRSSRSTAITPSPRLRSTVPIQRSRSAASRSSLYLCSATSTVASRSRSVYGLIR